uniref:CLAVATA3/ESR (CLE)-related protein n=1 Tax=Globodera pallida TaxID=36090 RepID=A0A183C9G0_GLOPA
MAKNAMFYLVILSVILALAFASNEKEAENHSAGIFGKVGRFVTVALAVSSRLGGAGASQGDGAVHGRRKGCRQHQIQSIAKQQLDGASSSNADEKCREVRKLTGIKPQRDVPSGPDPKHH